MDQQQRKADGKDQLRTQRMEAEGDQRCTSGRVSGQNGSMSEYCMKCADTGIGISLRTAGMAPADRIQMRQEQT